MASVGELFKFLGSNDIFQGLCQDSEKTNQQIIESAFQNEGLISTLRNIVQDDNIIKSKMDILIGQKRKNQTKKQEQVNIQLSIQNPNDLPTNQEEEVKEFKYVPINPDKVIYLDNFAYIERVDHRMRLVTHDSEMYY
jgi:hypothetical protein